MQLVHFDRRFAGTNNHHLGHRPHKLPGRKWQKCRGVEIVQTTLARTLAALSDINEAILYAKSPDELYQKVCDAGFSSGDFMAVAVFLAEPDGQRLRFAAGCGDDVARLRAITITTEAGTPEGAGVGGEAFRSQGICISNDYLNDPRSLAWREGAAGAGVGAAAALPLICGGRSIGVLYVTRSGAGTLDEAMVSLFERMSSNISHALENFARETARLDGERAVRRLNRMFGARSLRPTKQSFTPALSRIYTSGSAMPLCIAANRLPLSFCCASRIPNG
ncbi:GAF domain-containing protein [Bradyrhizobium sp. F1.13.1]